MGCWGITAFESDDGLRAIGIIREQLPKNGKADLREFLDAALSKDIIEGEDGYEGWVLYGGRTALAEMLVKIENGDYSKLDYEDQEFAEENKFGALQSLTADKETLAELKKALTDSIAYAHERDRFGDKWNGWFKESDWIGWNAHMDTLVSRMDEFLALPGDTIELIQAPELTIEPNMEI